MAEDSTKEVADAKKPEDGGQSESRTGEQSESRTAEQTESRTGEQAESRPRDRAESRPAEPASHAAGDSGRRRGRGRHVPAGIAYVKATFNNTMVSITDARGGVISWCSAGRAGFRGSRKSTAFAATVVAQDAARQAVARGMHEVEVRLQGAGSGRESAVRGLQSAGLNISVIKDMTPIPHNGCRPRKRRRV